MDCQRIFRNTTLLCFRYHKKKYGGNKEEWFEMMVYLIDDSLKGYDRTNLGWSLKRRLEYKKEREDLFLIIMSDTKSHISEKGKEITTEELNINIFDKMEIDEDEKTHFKIPIQTSSLIATIEIIEKMIHNEWVSENYALHYHGFSPSDINYLLEQYPNSTGLV